MICIELSTFSSWYHDLQNQKYEDAKKDGDITTQTTAADLLFKVQRENALTVMNILKDYNPTASGTAWGLDPDYQRMVKSLQKKTDFSIGATL